MDNQKRPSLSFSMGKNASLTNKTVDNSRFMANSGRISLNRPQVSWEIARDVFLAKAEGTKVARFDVKNLIQSLWLCFC